MSSTPRPAPRAPGPSRAARARTARSRSIALLLAGPAVAVALAVATGSDRAPADAGAPLAATGELNAMGMPVVATPGAADGTAAAGGVEVIGATWDLGTVPLDVAVRPTWTLRNTGAAPVTLGEPRPEVREGCCPGPLALGSRSLSPGESTTLTFELAMHAGMDGWHDLALHVPVEGDAGTEHLVLGVVGDFRG